MPDQIAQNEKRGRDLLLLQHIQHAGNVSVLVSRVKGQVNHPVRVVLRGVVVVDIITVQLLDKLQLGRRAGLDMPPDMHAVPMIPCVRGSGPQ